MRAALPLVALALVTCASPPPEDDEFWNEYLRRYSRYYPYKAIAIGEESYGFSYGQASPDDAIEAALETCESHDETGSETCELWALGHRVVDGIAPHYLVLEIQAYRARVIAGVDLEEPGDSPRLRVPLIDDYMWD